MIGIKSECIRSHFFIASQNYSLVIQMKTVGKRQKQGISMNAVLGSSRGIKVSPVDLEMIYFET